MTSSLDVLLDIAHTRIYLVGLLVGASNGGGGHGGAEARDDGVTPVEATARHKKARTRSPGLRRTYRARLHGLRWREVPQPR